MVVQDLFYHLPMTRLQGRVPQVRDHRQLSKGHNSDYSGDNSMSGNNGDRGEGKCVMEVSLD